MTLKLLRASRAGLLAAALHGFITAPLAAAVRCPTVFGDHMVLQRDSAVPVWGEAAPGEAVTVEFAGQRLAATAGADGKWLVRFAPLAASAESRTLTVAGTNTLAFTDVLVGEVWLCSGQSNMEKPVGQQRGQKPTDGHLEEIAAANHPLLRFYQVPRSGKPVDGDLTYRWLACTPESLDGMHFSAAGYFFGRELLRELKVPVGLIHASFGGTRIEVWMPPEGFARVPALAPFGEAAAAQRKHDEIVPSSLFRTMLEPLIPYATRGAIWYQGETNLMNVESDIYAEKMRALVESWRARWGAAPWPFYYVQLAPMQYAPRRVPRPLSPEALPRFWEVQTAALAIPHTGMIVTTDIAGDVRDIHPTNKRDVGLRLAWLALAKTYGRTDLEYSGPTFRKMRPAGAALELEFDHAAGLRSRDGQPLTYFTIAGADRKFVPATAELRGERLVVSAPSVAAPVAVRFAWVETATPNLANAAGLPARPFRTDDWPVEISRPAELADKLSAPLPRVTEPQIPDVAVRLTDFGGVGDGRTMNTAAFAAAIDALVAKGGGRVVVPPGLWLTGPIVLRSKIELRVERGATIQFSDRRADYPLVETSWEGATAWQCQSPIWGRNLEHVAITGEGIIDGAGGAWRPVKRDKLTESQWKKLVASGGVVDARDRIWYPSDGSRLGNEKSALRFSADAAGRESVRDAMRPVMVSLVECRFVKLEGVTFQNSPAWNLHPSLCDDVTVRRVNVRNPWFAQNGDGLDLESCRNVLVEQSTFDVGDDAICLKSGRDAEGRARARPTENVTVRECVVYHGHGGFVIGSEMSGGVRNIRVSECTFIGTDIGLRFKSGRGRGGVVENVLIEKVRMTGIPNEAISFNLYYTGREDPAAPVPAVTDATPAFRNILIRDTVCRGAEVGAELTGLPEMPVHDLQFENVTLIADTGIVARHVESLKLNKVTVELTGHAKTEAAPAAVSLHNSRGVALSETAFSGTASLLHVSGPRSDAITVRTPRTPAGKIVTDGGAPAGAVVVE